MRKPARRHISKDLDLQTSRTARLASIILEDFQSTLVAKASSLITMLDSMVSHVSHYPSEDNPFDGLELLYDLQYPEWLRMAV